MTKARSDSSSHDPYVLDLGKYGSRVFMGRSKGQLIRKKLGLSQFDKSERRVKVLIPEATVTMGSSFFLGLFGESVRSCGSAASFLQKFAFEGPEFIRTVVVGNNIERALFEGNSIFPSQGTDADKDGGE